MYIKSEHFKRTDTIYTAVVTRRKLKLCFSLPTVVWWQFLFFSSDRKECDCYPVAYGSFT